MAKSLGLPGPSRREDEERGLTNYNAGKRKSTENVTTVESPPPMGDDSAVKPVRTKGSPQCASIAHIEDSSNSQLPHNAPVSDKVVTSPAEADYPHTWVLLNEILDRRLLSSIVGNCEYGITLYGGEDMTQYRPWSKKTEDGRMLVAVRGSISQ
jgi:hypothetical protein